MILNFGFPGSININQTLDLTKAQVTTIRNSKAADQAILAAKDNLTNAEFSALLKETLDSVKKIKVAATSTTVSNHVATAEEVWSRIREEVFGSPTAAIPGGWAVKSLNTDKDGNNPQANFEQAKISAIGKNFYVVFSKDGETDLVQKFDVDLVKDKAAEMPSSGNDDEENQNTFVTRINQIRANVSTTISDVTGRIAKFVEMTKDQINWNQLLPPIFIFAIQTIIDQVLVYNTAIKLPFVGNKIKNYVRDHLIANVANKLTQAIIDRIVKPDSNTPS